MRRTLLLAAAAALLGACGSDLTFRPYEDPRLAAAFDAPSGWTVYTDGERGSPTAFTLFVHEPSKKLGAQWLGPTLAVHRLSRRKADIPGSDADFQAYRRNVLGMSENVFRDLVPGTSTATVAGFPARLMGAAYSIDVPRSAGQSGGQIPMKIVTAVVERPEAFYVIEYGSNDREFGQYVEVFLRAKGSFRIL